MLEKIPHGSRRYMGIFLSGRYDDCLDIRSELAVCIGNRPLRLEVYHVPDATDNVPDAELAAFVDSQIVILTPTATTTSSNMVKALFRILRWPAVKGSNDPGNIAVLFIF